MKFRFYHVFFLAYLLCTSCTNEDSKFDLDTHLYANVNTSVSSNDVLGTWDIYPVAFDDNYKEVPVSYQDCDSNDLLLL